MNSLAKTTRGVLLEFFVKPQNILVWLVAVLWYFPGVLGTISALELNIESKPLHTHDVLKSSSCLYFFDNFSRN